MPFDQTSVRVIEETTTYQDQWIMRIRGSPSERFNAGRISSRHKRMYEPDEYDGADSHAWPAYTACSTRRHTVFF
jgi:hypothetical protein